MIKLGCCMLPTTVAPWRPFLAARDRLEAHGHATGLRTGWANDDALGTWDVWRNQGDVMGFMEKISRKPGEIDICIFIYIYICTCK